MARCGAARGGHRIRRAGMPLACAGLLALAGCGFHLRGSYAIPDALAPVHVEAHTGSGVGRALTSLLQDNGVALASNAKAARTRLIILGESSQRRVLSVGSNGRVDEYEIDYTVRWRLVDASSGRDIVSPTRFDASRDYVYNPSSVLGEQSQQETITGDLRSDLAQRILFRLQAVDTSALNGTSD